MRNEIEFLISKWVGNTSRLSTAEINYDIIDGVLNINCKRKRNSSFALYDDNPLNSFWKLKDTIKQLHYLGIVSVNVNTIIYREEKTNVDIDTIFKQEEERERIEQERIERQKRIEQERIERQKRIEQERIKNEERAKRIRARRAKILYRHLMDQIERIDREDLQLLEWEKIRKKYRVNVLYEEPSKYDRSYNIKPYIVKTQSIGGIKQTPSTFGVLVKYHDTVPTCHYNIDTPLYRIIEEDKYIDDILKEFGY